MLKVLSGSLKGRAISTLSGAGVTRPPLSRVRKAIFDTIRPYLPGAKVLDVFGGSGSYSIEAVSNCASSATVLELSPAALKVIKSNLRALGLESDITAIQCDAFRMLRRLGAKGLKFEVVFVAPPQGKGMVEKTVSALLNSSVLEPGAIVVCQFANAEVGIIETGRLTEFKRQVYGSTEVAFLEYLEDGNLEGTSRQSSK